MDETAARRLQAAQELVDVDAVQAATSPVGPRDADGLDRVVHVDGSFPGFRLALRGRVWTVEEDVAGEWVQRGGHFQDQKGALGFLAKRVTPEVVLHPGPLTHDDVRAIVREEVTPALLASIGLGEDFPDRLLQSVLKCGDYLHEAEDRSPVDIGDAHPGVGGLDEGPLEILREAGLLEDAEVSVSKLFGRHEASPSVVDLGGSTVGDGQAAEGQHRLSAVEPPDKAYVMRVSDKLLVLCLDGGLTKGVTWALTNEDARDLMADLAAKLNTP